MMMNCRLMFLLCFYFFLSGVLDASAQDFLAITVSKEKKGKYQATLNSNKNVVAFIESKLVESGLPKMMRNLTMVESSFNKDLISTANAAGIWQFMEEHAADYGLKSEDRFDVYKSTLIAMRSLKNLYNKYGNWITVVAVYNCGEGNVKKAMVRANSNRYEKFYPYLPAETIHHVYKFMQACAVTDELGILSDDYKGWVFNQIPAAKEGPSNNKKREGLSFIEINGTYNLEVIADAMDMEIADLLYLNPTLNEELVQDGIASLYLPIDIMPDFLLLKNTILNRSLQNNKQHDE